MASVRDFCHGNVRKFVVRMSNVDSELSRGSDAGAKLICFIIV